MVGIDERLKLAIDRRSIGIPALAAAADVSYQAVKKILDGRTNDMKVSTLLAFAKKLQVDLVWLADGSGKMEAAMPTDSRAATPTEAVELLATALASLGPADQEAIGNHFQTLARAPDSEKVKSAIIAMITPQDAQAKRVHADRFGAKVKEEHQ